MASTPLALWAVCGFHVCSAHIIQDGLMAEKCINGKHIDKYNYFQLGRRMSLKVTVERKSFVQLLETIPVFSTPHLIVQTYHLSKSKVHSLESERSFTVGIRKMILQGNFTLLLKKKNTVNSGACCGISFTYPLFVMWHGVLHSAYIQQKR